MFICLMANGNLPIAASAGAFITDINRDFRIPGVPGVSHTKHSRKRSAQRGISRDMIQDTLDFGTCTCKQGLEFYTMRRKDLKDRFDPSYAEKVDGVVVVLGGDGCIRTAYKNKASYKRIAKKAKRLYRAA